MKIVEKTVRRSKGIDVVKIVEKSVRRSKGIDVVEIVHGKGSWKILITVENPICPNLEIPGIEPHQFTHS